MAILLDIAMEQKHFDLYLTNINPLHKLFRFAFASPIKKINIFLIKSL